MISMSVNGKEIKAHKTDTILQALQRVGIKVPTLCHLPQLVPTGACRLCVVEIEGFKNLVPACSYPVSEGLKIQTHSMRALRARKTIIELLLANHPDDCLYCSRNKNCTLQDLSAEFGVSQRRYDGQRSHHDLDLSSTSIARDPEKCILCGKCVRVCEEIQEVGAIDFAGRGSYATVTTAFNEGLNISSCINCGQCIMVCPTGALSEIPHLKAVTEALRNPKKVVVAQLAPAISVSIAEAFQCKPGLDSMGATVQALKSIGFDYVFDTSFSADLTVMEEASELIDRITNNKPLPMMTSCSPGWIKFVEQFYPHMTKNLSSCKSPQQMLGAIIKSYWAKTHSIDPDSIFSVSIMPCTAKKFEAQRPEMGIENRSDIDAVLTTREFAHLIKQHGLDLNNLSSAVADRPFGQRSSAGKLFGATGGVAEAALRTAYHLLTGEDLPDLKIKQLRGFEERKELHITVNDTQIGVAVVSGLKNARQLLEEIIAGRSDIHFIEVMTCPGGCIAGGGQPINVSPEAIKARMKTLYNIDRDEVLRTAHRNPEIKELYDNFLEKPLSEKSHHLLHTTYSERNVLM